jgi:hypothetical protein
MKFETEIELVNILTKTIKNIYGETKVGIFEEVSLGYGIADIVICRFIKPKEGISCSETTLNYFDINIYNLIRNYGTASLSEILQITRSSKTKVSTTIEKLKSNNYIGGEENSLFINKEYELLFSTNFAVEAKLKNWKRALQQAYRYKWFAEYSYVVLDAHYSNVAIRNIDSFKKYNVGLASITSEGKLVRHFNPRRQQPFDPIMQILFSERIKNNYEFAR